MRNTLASKLLHHRHFVSGRYYRTDIVLQLRIRMQMSDLVEREHIVQTLQKMHGVIDRPNGAAKILSLHPNTLRGRMRKLTITRDHYMS